MALLVMCRHDRQFCTPLSIKALYSFVAVGCTSRGNVKAWFTPEHADTGNNYSSRL